MYVYFTTLILLISIAFIFKHLFRNNKKYYELFDTILLAIIVIFFGSEVLSLMLEIIRNIII